MTQRKAKSNVWWLLCLVPLAALPIAIPASVESGVPLGVSLLAWSGLLAFPVVSITLLRGLERWLKRFGESIMHAVIALAGGITYLVEILAVIGICRLWGMEFTRGPCAFVSMWHYGHLFVPAGLVLLAAIQIVIEQRRTRSDRELKHHERLASWPA